MPPTHTLMVADDHPLFREAIGAVIETGLPGCRLLEADSLARALEQAQCRQDIDLLLLDLDLPDAEGLSGLAQLREALPQLAVAIVSAEQDRRIVLDAIGMGAVGYIPKSTPRTTLLNALAHMLEGQVYLPPDIMRRPPASGPASPRQAETAFATHIGSLTDKQREVLALMIRGYSNKLIARELDIAETTVKTHVSAILRKLGVTSRVQAIVAAGAQETYHG
ncbi:LuxR C-terminal-related transcriptional regulator [Billgrantia lactosivorans]|uniref:LuxR C-terminal-related transcriptional regulator n=1 Tax=Billgrantia lactosivorans TaxID=2185141 RepID=UPI000DACC012|nr:response regulator transcription factor [Halomonas lactosivorans]